MCLRPLHTRGYDLPSVCYFWRESDGAAAWLEQADGNGYLVTQCRPQLQSSHALRFRARSDAAIQHLAVPNCISFAN